MKLSYKGLVAPRAGAWIETRLGVKTAQSEYRRAPCGRVD